MLGLKLWINKATQWMERINKWINGYGFHYISDYGTALKNATTSNMWECPATGFLTISSGTVNGQRAYWYVFAEGGAPIGIMTRLETANYRLGMMIPVLKGAKYYLQHANLSADSKAYLYRVGGYCVTQLFQRFQGLGVC